jgi:hypothetical protein
MGSAGSTQDESGARLHVGPSGEILRVWTREGDTRTGGGAVLVAAARPRDTWHTLVEIHSPEKGVTIRGGDLAIGPSNQLALAYRWWRNDPRSKQLRVARSDDSGKTWTQPPTQIDASGQSFEPKIAWARGRSLVVAWADERRGGRLFDIYARRSPDGGTTWEPEQLLSRFPRNLPSDIHARPVLLSDGQDRLWLIWVGVRTGRSSLYLNRSADAGKTWTDPTPLTGDSRSVFGQTLVRAGDQLLLVWHDTRTEHDRIYSVTSRDGGATWTSPVRVDHLPADSQVDASSPAVLLSPDGEALVAWQDARNGRDDIFLSRSTDGGRSWPTEDQRMEMDEPGTAVSRFPWLAKAADGRVAIVWEDDRAGHEGAYARIRSAGPKPEWGPEVLVKGPDGKLAARIPRAIWSSDGLHVVWEVWDYTLAPARITKHLASRVVRPDGK